MKNTRDFLSENFKFLEVKLSIYLNRRVFVMVHPGEGQNHGLCASSFSYAGTS